MDENGVVQPFKRVTSITNFIHKIESLSRSILGMLTQETEFPCTIPVEEIFNTVIRIFAVDGSSLVCIQ